MVVSKSITVSTDIMDPGHAPELGSENESAPSSEQQDEQQSPDDSTGAGSIKGEHGDENAADSSSSLPTPVQKRRRVTRACDECRRKKIKCDGKQPCTHCSVYSYECTYDKPSNRRRNPAPQYIEALENKLARAESLLRKFIPDVDLNDTSLDPAVQQEFHARERQRQLQAAAKARREAEEDAAAAHRVEQQSEARIQSMIETIGQLDLDERGGWDFRGTSSGAVFLRRMKEHFGGLLGYDHSTTFLPRPPSIPGLTNLDAFGGLTPTGTTGASPGEPDLSDVYNLPPRDRAHHLSSCALTCATALLRIVHVPSFFERFEDVYNKPAEDFEAEDKKFLGLLYAVMAVGAMYNIAEEDGGNQASYKDAAEEGMKYYTCARRLLQNITECRDLTSLQALLFLILFLQAISNLSGCYAFLGIASRAALRMGLHRHLPHAKFTPLVTELRRRVFYVIRQLDIYCSALLGFPILLHDEDIDQRLPTEVDDEFITADGIRAPPAGTPGSIFEAFNAHSRLMKILMKVVKYIYPLKSVEECAANPQNARYMIDYRRIKEIETDLQVWHEQLPPRWRPSAEGPIEVMRVRTLLRFAYAHVQMMLYRPFLHYISPRLSAGRAVDERYYACAAAGISVSRNVIHIAMEMRNQALVVGPFWSMLYTEFFAILTLVFYVLENTDKPGSAEIFADAVVCREMISKMALKSYAADRISKSLDTLWENLPEHIKSGKAKPVPSRKRSAPGPKPGPVPLSTHKTPGPAPKIASAASRKSLNHRPSFDTTHRTSSSASQQTLSSLHYPDLHPLDVPSTNAVAAPPDMSGATNPSSTTAHPSSQYMRAASSSQTLQSPSIYKLDAMMFPSGDPFAYPNQPLVDYGGGGGAAAVATHPESNPSHISAVQSHQTDARNFYMPGMYGDIEGQLAGPLPPYLMQPNGQGQNGLDLSAQMYQPPSTLAVHPSHHAGHMHHHHQHHNPQHGRATGREMDDLMADSGYNRAWDMFGTNFKPL